MVLEASALKAISDLLADRFITNRTSIDLELIDYPGVTEHFFQLVHTVVLRVRWRISGKV